MTKEKPHHEPDLENFTGQIYSNATTVDSDIANSSDIESQKNSYKEKNAVAEKIAPQECRIKNGSKIVASPSMREALQRKTTMTIDTHLVVVSLKVSDSVAKEEIKQGNFEVCFRLNKKQTAHYQFAYLKNHLEKKILS